MNGSLPNGVEIAINIKNRCRALKKTIPSVCEEAKVSYDSYKNWRSGRIEPRIRSVQKIETVLKAHEQSGEGMGHATNQNDQA